MTRFCHTYGLPLRPIINLLNKQIMDITENSPEQMERFEEEQLALESLKGEELNFVVGLAHLLRSMQKKGIVINYYSVNTDKCIIIMENNNNLNE